MPTQLSHAPFQNSIQWLLHQVQSLLREPHHHRATTLYACVSCWVILKLLVSPLMSIKFSTYLLSVDYLLLLMPPLTQVSTYTSSNGFSFTNQFVDLSLQNQFFLSFYYNSISVGWQHIGQTRIRQSLSECKTKGHFTFIHYLQSCLCEAASKD